MHLTSDNPSSSAAVSNPRAPFQFNVTLGSPLFKISPIASNDTLGWVPSCLSPVCLPNASWSTGVVNSTLDFSYWGWSAALDGVVEGDMTIQLTYNGQQEWWNPSKGTLFTIKASPIDQYYLHNITLKVVSASSDARLTVTQARINGPSSANSLNSLDRWTLAGDDPALKYTGFTQHPSPSGQGSPTYVSTSAGDKAYMSWNGSAVLLYGSCGPSNGLMRVTIDGFERTLNLSNPFQSNDCLLFQSHSTSPYIHHRLEIENLGGFLEIGRMEIFHASAFRLSGPLKTIGDVVLTTLAAIVLAFVVVAVYTMRTRRTAKKVSFDEYLEPLIGDSLNKFL
ncbi:unnamed protein product [Rhizoctonia solani]|uniref:Uncharacterized protein n=1 Tax=Rhizoctonia solani TaxID=456999 RepID=A0A8H3E2Z0_9AGAM|nr:unnamed protein product [Rhizoctonia solani]